MRAHGRRFVVAAVPSSWLVVEETSETGEVAQEENPPEVDACATGPSSCRSARVLPAPVSELPLLPVSSSATDRQPGCGHAHVPVALAVAVRPIAKDQQDGCLSLPHRTVPGEQAACLSLSHGLRLSCRYLVVAGVRYGFLGRLREPQAGAGRTL